MKKFLSLLAILAVFGANSYATEIEKGTIVVNSKSQKEFTPNVAKIKFYVETQDKNLQIATDKNKQDSNRALEAIKKELNTTKGDTIQTINFNASPQYSYKNGTRTFLHYKVSNGFEVTLKNTEKLGTIISKGLNNGATRVDNLNFSLDNTENACQELIKEAVQIAKTRANTTAKAADTIIEGIKTINTNCSADVNWAPSARMYSTKAMNSTDEAAGDIPTELGTIKMFATVNAQYFVK